MANLISWLLRAQKAPALSWGARQILALYGVEFPPSVAYGSSLNIVHRGFGLVVSPFVTFGAHVTVYHGVTLGRSDSWVPLAGREAPSIAVEDHAVLCPGAKVLATPGITCVLRWVRLWERMRCSLVLRGRGRSGRAFPRRRWASGPIDRDRFVPLRVRARCGN